MITRRVKAIRKCRTHFNNVSSFVICTSSFGPSITFLFHPTQKSPVRHVRILAPLEHTHRHEIFRHAGRAASLESAFARCFGTVVKNQRHPFAGGNFNQSARLLCSLELLRATSDRHKPSKLIKNQNASTINADKLKAKMSETIISSAPPAFSSEYLGDELGSLSSCRSKYATTISRTPMNPARSNKCKFIVIARRSESRVPAPHYNHCHDWFSTASTGAASDSNPLNVARRFRPIGA